MAQDKENEPMAVEKYRQAFVEAFELENPSVVDQLEYNAIEEWDSIGTCR